MSGVKDIYDVMYICMYKNYFMRAEYYEIQINCNFIVHLRATTIKYSLLKLEIVGEETQKISVCFSGRTPKVRVPPPPLELRGS